MLLSCSGYNKYNHSIYGKTSIEMHEYCVNGNFVCLQCFAPHSYLTYHSSCTYVPLSCGTKHSLLNALKSPFDPAVFHFFGSTVCFMIGTIIS